MAENDYRVNLVVDRLTCRNAESSGRADRILLVGAVSHNGEHSAFTMSTYGIPGQASFFEQGLAPVFEGDVEGPEIRVQMTAWDIDANADWVENRDTVIAISNGVAAGLTAANPVVGGAYEAFANTVISVIDKFVEWDKSDLLMEYDQVISLGAVWGSDHTQTIEVNFSGGDDAGYSDWDYTLQYYVNSQRGLPPIFGPGDVGRIAYLPAKGTTTADWVGDWVEDGGVTVSIRETAGLQERMQQRLGDHQTVLEVTATELAEGKPLSTTTSYATIEHTVIPGPDRLSTDRSALGDLIEREVEDDRTRLGDPPAGLGALLGREPENDSASDDAPVGLEVLLGRRIEPSDAITDDRQIGGDRLVLEHDATLEAFRMHSEHTDVTTPALRYVRPQNRLARAADPWSRDVMLHLPPNL